MKREREAVQRGSYGMPVEASTVFRAWIFFLSFAAWVLAVVTALRGELLWTAVCAAFALAADMAGRVWSRKSPVPMPYFMRWVLLLPRGPHSPKRLKQVLQPRSGERILEIGPGIGVHALPIASSLLPNGVLDVLDVQQEMLDELARRAERSGLTNIVPKQGDAQQLPYPDRSFDAAYLIGVLGEIPNAVMALRELRRVLKPDGRLIISELFIDPDFISLPGLHEKAVDAGFVFERRAGPSFAYSAVFRPAAALPPPARTRVRDPQYVGFVAIMLGFLLQWPTLITLVMFPILVLMYIRLAHAEERDAIATFGERCVKYMAATPGFIPRFRILDTDQ